MLNIVIVDVIIFYALKSASATDVGVIPVDPHCSSLPASQTCCRSRQDNCWYERQVLLGNNTTRCYCDSQCYNAVNPSETDCCNDYIEHCGSFHRLEDAIKRSLENDLIVAKSNGAKAMYKYATNMTAENEQEQMEALGNLGPAHFRFVEDAWTFYGGPLTGRTKHMFDVIGKTPDSNPDTDYHRSYDLQTNMTNTFMAAFHTAKEIKEPVSRWQALRDSAGRTNRKSYLEFINIYNHSNVDMTKDWRVKYFMPDDEFKSMLTDIYNEILPLYESIFTFVRRKNKEKNANDTKIQTSKTLYPHVWSAKIPPLSDLGLEDGLNLTELLVKQNYTIIKMAHLAESFYKSLNLGELSDYFWNRSMLEKPSDGRPVRCQPNSYNFYYEGQYAIVACLAVDASGYFTIFHEMGHIYYMKEYSSQPVFFRDGASPAFHEAIGDTMHFSAVAPAFLKHAKLIDSSIEESKEMLVGRLLGLALATNTAIVTRLDLFLQDLYRWKLIDRSILENNMNSGFWDLRYKYLVIIHHRFITELNTRDCFLSADLVSKELNPPEEWRSIFAEINFCIPMIRQTFSEVARSYVADPKHIDFPKADQNEL